MTDSIKKHWGYILVIFLSLAMLVYFAHRLESSKEVEIVTVPATDSTTLAKYMPDITLSEAKEVSSAIDKAQTSSSPTYVYYTTNQTVADKTAQSYAATQKADKIVKTTETKTVTESKEVTAEDKTVSLNGGDSLIENNYYAINLEKKHEVKVGAAMVNHHAYATVSYRNRDLTYTAMYSPAHKEYGVAISYTVAKW